VEVVSVYPKYTSIYTNGSLVNKSALNLSSVYTPELYAIHEILLYISCQSQRHFLICLDFFSAVWQVLLLIYMTTWSQPRFSTSYLTSMKGIAVFSVPGC